MRYIAWAAMLCVCVPAVAGTVSPVRIGDVPVGHWNANRDTKVYDNTASYTGYYYPGGADVEDDIHVDPHQPFVMTGFSFGYYDSVATPPTNYVSATITFYEWTSDFQVPGAVLAGPYTLFGIPSPGAWILSYQPDPVVLPPDFWMGVSFLDPDYPDAGLMIYGPPAIGTSHDLFMQDKQGPYSVSPVSDFCLAVSTPEPASLLLLGVTGLLIRRR
ncbi:MAG TPA: hypothetical protein VMT24_19960 [Aggregatilineaceae bacterium]|nr:hypothetical protein [Aggregatilineaceae bacterium]